MAKDVLVHLDDAVYTELVSRAGGPRSISKFLNTFLPAVFAEQVPDLATMYRELRELRQDVEALKRQAEEGLNIADDEAINNFIQSELRRRNLDSVTVVDANTWLEEAGLLSDRPRSSKAQGLPLRRLCWKGAIRGQRQEPPRKGGDWFIDRVI